MFKISNNCPDLYNKTHKILPWLQPGTEENQPFFPLPAPGKKKIDKFGN
jgi:hypothetical protein